MVVFTASGAAEGVFISLLLGKCLFFLLKSCMNMALTISEVDIPTENALFLSEREKII